MSASDPRRLALPESLGAAEAAGLADQLRALRGAPVEIDASAVRKMGGLCAQILLSAAATWRADATTLRLSEPSPEMVAALGHMGLDAAALEAGDAS